MSYARWGWDASDVYVFEAIDYMIECCGCDFTTVKLDKPYTDMFGIEHTHSTSSFFADTRGKMVEHLHNHIEKGDCVPQACIDDLVKAYPNADQTIKDFYLNQAKDANE